MSLWRHGKTFKYISWGVRTMADNFYNDTLSLLAKVFDAKAAELNVSNDPHDSVRSIVEKQKMKAILAFREAYRTAEFDVHIHRGR